MVKQISQDDRRNADRPSMRGEILVRPLTPGVGDIAEFLYPTFDFVFSLRIFLYATFTQLYSPLTKPG